MALATEIFRKITGISVKLFEKQNYFVLALLLCFTNTPVLAALESVPTITVWCDYSPTLYGAGCFYHTDLEAAQALAALRATDKGLIPIVIDSCDGNGNCIFHYPIGPSAGISQVLGYPVVWSAITCPVPINYPSIKYEINQVSGLCERNTPDNLIITLSGGAITRPWHRKFDRNHNYAEANLPYKAIVVDQNGQPKANISVTVTTDVVSGSGGHAHYYARPKGKLVDRSGIGTSTLAGQASISGVTDSKGVFAFTFGSEEASGGHTIIATCTGCSAPANAKVNVGIQGLMQLDADPLGYTLTGDKPIHPDNHYYSPEATVRIINLAFAYKRKFRKPIIINDSSLIQGGVFDIEQDWTTRSNKHGGHRIGIVVDINNYTANPTPPFEQFPDPDFEDFAATLGIQADPHPSPGHPMGTAPHYHLLLLGAGHDQ